MTRAFLDRELDTVATFWRIWRTDGVALGFTTHDRDLWFGSLMHRAAPGLTPSAIRRSVGFSDLGSDVEGALAHDCISESEVASGRYDGAVVAIGAVNWETLENAIYFRGTIEAIAREGNGFTAQIASVKAALAVDPVPRSSPACRARFCDTGCGLSPARFTRRARVASVDDDRVLFEGIDHGAYQGGELRWRDGPLAGLSAQVLSADQRGILLDRSLAGIEPGTTAFLRQGCDHTIATCAARFDNATNFQGEPFLPGTDLLAHYPLPR